MPNYNLGETFDLGRAYSQAALVRGAEQNQELHGLQMEAAKLALEKAKQPEPISYETALGNVRLARGGFAAVLANPDRAAEIVESLKQQRVLPADFVIPPGTTREQIMAEAQRGLDQTTAWLEAAEKPQDESIGTLFAIDEGGKPIYRPGKEAAGIP